MLASLVTWLSQSKEHLTKWVLLGGAGTLVVDMTTQIPGCQTPCTSTLRLVTWVLGWGLNRREVEDETVL